MQLGNMWQLFNLRGCGKATQVNASRRLCQSCGIQRGCRGSVGREWAMAAEFAVVIFDLAKYVERSGEIRITGRFGEMGVFCC